MWKASVLVLGMALSMPVLSQAAAAAPAAFAPQLQPGEALAVGEPNGDVQLFGEAQKEAPMGSLAKLVWLRLEGEEWGAMGVEYKCTGQMGPYKCWLPKGHGRVDLAKATQESCNLAFLAWAQMSAQRWREQYGEGAGRARLEDTFSPFLGNRLPQGDTIPDMTPQWIGDGDLLRTSPEAMLRWLMDPTQDTLLSRCRRLLLGFFGDTFREHAWWMKTGTAGVLSDPAATSAWVAGSDGRTIAVLHLPRGRGKAEGLARFRELMGISGK